MIRSRRFVEELQDAGLRFFSGVPCSYLTALIDELVADQELPYIAATNEGDAIAIAAGAELGGNPGVVFFQNSGLGNAVSPLTSLTWTFRIPLLVVTTWRGEPGGSPDEPQHDLMGVATTTILDAMRIPWSLVPEDEEDLAGVLARAAEHMESERTPYGLVVRKGVIGEGPGRTRGNFESPIAEQADARSSSEALDPDAALASILAASVDDALLTTTGFTGRALYALADRPNHLYMVGSMGCVSSLGLGLAVTCPDKRIITVDGDGAFLMRMGALATIGHVKPKNLVHVLLDNGVHDSTGSQETVSRSIDPVSIARACGYPRALRIETASELQAELQRPTDRLTFLHVPTSPRASRALPRPDTRPHEVADRLRQWLRDS